MRRLFAALSLVALSGCSMWSAEQPLPEPYCFTLESESLGDEGIEIAMQAIDAWEPLSIDLKIDIDGDCQNRIQARSDKPQFTRENPAGAYTYKQVLLDGSRGKTVITLNSAGPGAEHVDWVYMLTHEFGHALGLEEHSSDRWSVMYWSPPSAPGGANQGARVTTRDRGHVAALYR